MIRQQFDPARLNAHRGGEAGALRAWVAASGKRPEDFVREERTRQRATLAAARAAASDKPVATR